MIIYLSLFFFMIKQFFFNIKKNNIKTTRQYKYALMPEWSKGCDSSSHSESFVGSNPTQCIFL